MKIKKLTLRNIASIEKAEIDFERGLNDAVSGAPASVFLISGDTGAGKSVILDGISMALYKKTPRLVDVSNKKGNEYTNTEGESISVNSIEQYTRLGISPKDDCYSEVVFEGNDGVEYHARLTLGIYVGKKDSNGDNPIKLRKPKWEVKVGNEDYVNVEVKTGQPILNAIGLTFDQFSRMAMLAQGQFANFLTGDKKEREAILEKLTNTEHFSVYGEAIYRLFKKTEAAKSQAQTQYDTNLQHVLSQEIVDKLNQDLNTQQATKAEREKEQAENDRKLEALNAIRDNKTKENTAQQNLENSRNRFELLSADLLSREEDRRQFEEGLAKQETWLQGQANKKQLYEKADAVEVKLENLKSEQNKKATAITEKSKLEAKTKEFEADLETKKKAETEAGIKVKVKQDEIDRLTNERELLKPTETNDSLNSATLRKGDLEKLKTSLDQLYSEAIPSANAMAEEIKKAEVEQERLKKTKEEEEGAWSKAKQDSERAEKLLITMQMSVEDTLVNLRMRLSEEHTEICPLCGQHISELSIDEDFHALITPLKEEQSRAAAVLTEAERKKNEANREFDNADGMLKAKKKQLEDANRENKQKQVRLEADARRLQLDPTQDLLPQVKTELDKSKEKIKSLQECQKKAELLQNEINKLRNEKAPLDTQLTSAQEARHTAEQALQGNKQGIKAQDDNMGAANSAITGLLNELRPLLDGNYKDWEQHIDETREALQKAATIYREHQQEFDKSKKDLGNKKDENARLKTSRQNVIKLYPEWGKVELSAATYPCPDIHAAWTELYGMCKSSYDAIKVAKEEIARRMEQLGAVNDVGLPQRTLLDGKKIQLATEINSLAVAIGGIQGQLNTNAQNIQTLNASKVVLDQAKVIFEKWNSLNNTFGGTRFRTLVQTYILRPLLINANTYLQKITDRYTLTCSEDNEQLSILVLDNYNRGQVRSATLLSGGERFMISLALSLALSSLNRPDMNVNILFIDEGFGTLDEKSLDSVMATLEKLQVIAGQSERRVGIISHREELEDRIPVQIRIHKKGQGRSSVDIVNQ